MIRGDVMLVKIRKEHPILLAIGLTMLYVLILNNIGRIFTTYFWNFVVQYYSWLSPIAQFVAVLVGAAAIWLAGEKEIFRQRGEGFFKGLYIGGFFIVIGLLSIVGNIEMYGQTGNFVSAEIILMYIIYFIEVGIAEEFVYRGAILNTLMKHYGKNTKGVYIAIIISSLLFSCMHLSNIFAGVSVTGAIIQAIATVPMGMLFAAIYLRSRNIWAVAFLHGFIDIAASTAIILYGEGSVISIVSGYNYMQLVGALVYLIPFFILLRQRKMEEVLLSYNEESDDMR